MEDGYEVGQDWVIDMNRVAIIALIVVLTVLMMVQVPLDLRTHQLSRTATLRAMIAVTLIVVIDTKLA